MPGSATFVLDDPDEFGVALPELRMSLVVSGPGVFEARLKRIELTHTLLLSCGENLPRVAHCSLGLRSACLLFPTREVAPVSVAGVNVQFGDVLFFGQGRRFHARTTGPVSWGCILFRPSLSRTGCLSIGQDLRCSGSGWVARPARPLIRRLLRLHRQAAQSASRFPKSVSDAGSAAELEQLLIEAARGCMASAPENKTEASGQSHLDIMNRFQDIVQASPYGLISQADLQARLGVSGRLLRFCCQQHLGMGPARYLRLYRLKLVRRALLRADPKNRTVKDISSLYGFHEAGRFAVVYRAMFGKSPSIALRRTLDSLPVSGD